MFYLDQNGKKIETMWNKTYMVIAGKCGLAINALSFYHSFRITVTSDDGVFNKVNTVKLCNYTEENIRKEILHMEQAQSTE